MGQKQSVIMPIRRFWDLFFLLKFMNEDQKIELPRQYQTYFDNLTDWACHKDAAMDREFVYEVLKTADNAKMKAEALQLYKDKTNAVRAYEGGQNEF